MKNTHMLMTKTQIITRKAFTLIEILIVGMLISLFAGLAIFNVQRTYQDNLKKAIIGETRQLGTAMAMCYQDTGMFPKIPFLQESQVVLERNGNQWFPGEDPNTDPQLALFRRYDYWGFGTTVFAHALYTNWKGPYFSSSQTRKTLSQGRLGTVRMFFPDLNNNSMDWPADAWSQPYVFYAVSIGKFDNQLYFVQAPSDVPNYFIAIVSYGPNGVPGANGTPSELLYKQGTQRGDFIALDINEYNTTRANAVDKIKASGSDDIIYEF